MHGLNTEELKNLLCIILKNSYFQYCSKVFSQFLGLPVGSTLSRILAILFMDRLERKALMSFQQIKPNKRCLDDINNQATN